VIMMTNPFGDDWVDFPARQMQIDFEVSGGNRLYVSNRRMK